MVLPPVLERMASAPAAPTAPSRPSTFTPASVPVSRAPSTGFIPPAKEGMSARQQREEMIREKRREQKLRDSGEFYIPPRRDLAGKLVDDSPAARRHSGGRPSNRRSLSTGDAEDLGSTVRPTFFGSFTCILTSAPRALWLSAEYLSVRQHLSSIALLNLLRFIDFHFACFCNAHLRFAFLLDAILSPWLPSTP